MTDKGSKDDSMAQYFDVCQEQIKKLAEDPKMLEETLKPFVQMSQQLMAGGLLDGMVPNMLPGIEGLNFNSAVDQLNRIKNYIVEYIKDNPEELMKMYNSRDRVIIRDLNKDSKELRDTVKQLVLDLRSGDKE